jgi:hypothetical protein
MASRLARFTRGRSLVRSKVRPCSPRTASQPAEGVTLSLSCSGPAPFGRGVIARTLSEPMPAMPASAELAAPCAVSAVCSFVVAYEVLRLRDARVRVRHPELAA